MLRTINGYSVEAEDDVWEWIDESAEFNEFIGKCLSHFVHFVIPRRDQTVEIEQDYQISDDIEISSSSSVLLHRDLENKIAISFITW